MLHQVRFGYVGKDGGEEVTVGHIMETEIHQSLLETHTFNLRSHWHHTNQWLLSYGRRKNGGGHGHGHVGKDRTTEPPDQVHLRCMRAFWKAIDV